MKLNFEAIKSTRFSVLIVVCAITFAAGLLVASSYTSSIYEGVSPSNEPSSLIKQNELIFSAVGDFDIGERFGQTLDNLANGKPHFVLALGDFSYSKTSEKDWCNQVNAKVKIPFQLVAGNHDIEPLAKIEKFSACLPNRIPNLVGSYPDSYYFDYQKLARIIVISPDIEVGGHKAKFTKDDPDYTWLKETISEAKKQNISWVVVAMHKNCLSVGIKSCEIGQDLSDLLVSQKVDLILQGHEHAYMRSKQLVISDDCKTISPLSINPESCAKSARNGKFYKSGGSILAIVGSGGAEERPINMNSASLNLFESYYGGSEPVYGVLQIGLTSDRLVAKFVQNQTSEIKDSFTIASE